MLCKRYATVSYSAALLLVLLFNFDVTQTILVYFETISHVLSHVELHTGVCNQAHDARLLRTFTELHL